MFCLIKSLILSCLSQKLYSTQVSTALPWPTLVLDVNQTLVFEVKAHHTYFGLFKFPSCRFFSQQIPSAAKNHYLCHLKRYFISFIFKKITLQYVCIRLVNDWWIWILYDLLNLVPTSSNIRIHKLRQAWFLHQFASPICENLTRYNLVLADLLQTVKTTQCTKLVNNKSLVDNQLASSLAAD